VGFGVREEGILDARATALLENKGLVHLVLQYCRLGERVFCEYFRALSTHPSLRTLDLTFRDLDMDATTATKAIVDALSVDKQLEGIRIEDGARSSFDSSA
jgi:hypothetical protein